MLKQLGLGHDEALVYATLAFLGPTRASTVAAATQLSRPQAYRALEMLSGRGVIRSDLSRPRIYTAAPVESVLTHLRTTIESHAQELRLLEPDLRKLLSAVPIQGRPPTFRTDILRGRQVVVAHAHEVYEAAQREISLVFTHPGGLPLVKSLGGWDKLVAKAKAGVRIRLIVRPLEDYGPFEADAAKVQHLEIHFLETTETMACLMTDRQSALVVLLADPMSYPRADRTVALASDAPTLATLLASSFEALWSQTRPPASPRRHEKHGAAPEPRQRAT